VIELSVDGEPLRAPAGQSIAAALLAAGRAVLGTGPSGRPRSLYCGIGVCQECRVQADGRVVRACVTPVRAGMTVVTDPPRRSAPRAGSAAPEGAR
jgi:D-hydroxyproline dehydrogenase subunit gamma